MNNRTSFLIKFINIYLLIRQKKYLSNRKKVVQYGLKRANFLDQIFRKLRYKDPAHFLLNLCHGTGWEPDNRDVIEGSLGYPFFQDI